jgi:hypothetical protein
MSELETKLDLTDWSKAEVHLGVPSMLLLPARHYSFKVANPGVKIVVPRSGKYADLAPEVFDESDGEFELLNSDGVLYLPAISKVLFAKSLYPDLTDTQLFVPISIKFSDDEVEIIGQILELVSPEEAMIDKDTDENIIVN